MHEPYLVRVHEARVAHHVAAIREVDGQHGATAVLDRAAAVVVQLLVVVGADVSTGKHIFEMLEERRVHRHHVLEMAMKGTVLHHQNLSVSFQNRGLDLADLFIQQDADVLLAVENLLTRFPNAPGAERIGLPRPAERRLRLLIRLQKGFVRPPRCEGRPLVDAVQSVEDHPSTIGG